MQSPKEDPLTEVMSRSYQISRSVLLLARSGGDERVGAERVWYSRESEERHDDVEGDGREACSAGVGEDSAFEHLHRVGVDEGEPQEDGTDRTRGDAPAETQGVAW